MNDTVVGGELLYIGDMEKMNELLEFDEIEQVFSSCISSQ